MTGNEKLKCAVVEIRCRNGHVHRRQMTWRDLGLFLRRARCPRCRCGVSAQTLGCAAKPTDWEAFAPNWTATAACPPRPGASSGPEGAARRGRPRSVPTSTARNAR